MNNEDLLSIHCYPKPGHHALKIYLGPKKIEFEKKIKGTILSGQISRLAKEP